MPLVSANRTPPGSLSHTWILIGSHGTGAGLVTVTRSRIVWATRTRHRGLDVELQQGHAWQPMAVVVGAHQAWPVGPGSSGPSGPGRRATAAPASASCPNP